jgi:hypothetical protein
VEDTNGRCESHVGVWENTFHVGCASLTAGVEAEVVFQAVRLDQNLRRWSSKIIGVVLHDVQVYHHLVEAIQRLGFHAALARRVRGLNVVNFAVQHHVACKAMVITKTCVPCTSGFRVAQTLRLGLVQHLCSMQRVEAIARRVVHRLRIATLNSSQFITESA